MGEKIKVFEEDETVINLSEFSKGVYLLKLTYDNGEEVTKIVNE